MVFNDYGVNRQWMAEIDFLGSLSGEANITLSNLCTLVCDSCFVYRVSWFKLRNLLYTHLAVVSLSLLTSTRPTI